MGRRNGPVLAERGQDRRLEESSNARVDWDTFDPQWYAAHNYQNLEADDRKIVQTMRDFFGSVLVPNRSKIGLDVGSGANLYPALAMLPFCHRIDLQELGARNVAWLRREIHGGYSPMWDPYWQQLSFRSAYQRVDNPRHALAHAAKVNRQSIFKLRKDHWGVGTMSFVAESLSDQEREFKLAVRCFVSALKTGAPFAAAFMGMSSGYYVNGTFFPAVAITETDVKECLTPLASDLEVIPVRSDEIRRTGYRNMIVALGRADVRRRS